MTGCRLGAGFPECSAIIWKAGSKQTFAAGQTAGDGGLEARKQGLKLQVWKVIETSAENVALSRRDTLAMRRFDSLLQETSLFLNIYFQICLDVTLTWHWVENVWKVYMFVKCNWILLIHQFIFMYLLRWSEMETEIIKTQMKRQSNIQKVWT